MIAHPLGHGVQHMVMLSACLRIAQCLGLAEQKPSPTNGAGITPRQSSSARINEEVIRRVWWQLIVQDYFLVPMAGSYGTNFMKSVNVIFHSQLKLLRCQSQSLHNSLANQLPRRGHD